MKTIVLVCYGGGHVKTIAPLYLELKNDYKVILIALTSAGTYLDSINIPYVTFKDFLDLFDKEVIEYGTHLAKSLPINSVVNHDDSIAYLGCSFYDLVLEHGLCKARELYSSKGRAIFFPEHTLSIILNHLKPDLLITTNAPRAERASLKVAKKLSIKSICINDNLWFDGGVSEVVLNNLADIVCVLAEQVKSGLELYNPNIDIRVTGTPLYDYLKKQACEKVIGSQLSILFADCDLPSRHPMYPNVIADGNLGNSVRDELNRLAAVNDWNVIFRPHPNQAYSYEKYSNIHISEKSESLHGLLASVDVVITAVSTVGVEGKLAGTGLVSIEGTVFGSKHSYFDLNLSTPVYSAEDLESAILAEASSTSRNNMALYDGVATENILRCINDLLK